MDRTIEPGQTDKVEIVLSLGPRAGKTSRKITGQSNDRNMASFALECVADVNAALNIEPIAVNFGNVSRSAAAQTKSAVITRGSGGPIKPTVVSTGNEQITTEVKEVEPGERYELLVTANPPWPNDLLRGTIALDTGVERSPREEITVFLRVAPRLTTSPANFRVPYEVPADLALKAQLQWSDGEPGHVLSASVNDPRLSAEVVEENERQTVVLHVPKGYTGVTGRKYLVTLATDDPGAKAVDVPIFVMRAPAAADPGTRGLQVGPGALGPPAPAGPPAPPTAPPAPPPGPSGAAPPPKPPPAPAPPPPPPPPQPQAAEAQPAKAR